MDSVEAVDGHEDGFLVVSTLVTNVTLLYANRTPDFVYFVYKGELEGLAGKHPHLNIHYFVAPERITE